MRDRRAAAECWEDLVRSEHCGLAAEKSSQIQFDPGCRYNFFTGCPKAKTCTIILRGGAEQFMEETELGTSFLSAILHYMFLLYADPFSLSSSHQENSMNKDLLILKQEP